MALGTAKWSGGSSACALAGLSARKPTTGLQGFDQDLSPPLVLWHLALTEDEFDSARVVFWDEALVPQGIDQGLAATDSVVDVEELGPVAGDRKPITSACLASALSRVRIQWFRPSIVLRLGVT